MKLLSRQKTLKISIALSATLLVSRAWADVNQGTYHIGDGVMGGYESGMMKGYGYGWMSGMWLPTLLLMIIVGLVVWIITIKKK